MIKACIFDMDGTTVNTIESIKYFANNALEKYGFDGYDTEAYKIMVGNGARTLVTRMIEGRGGDSEALEKVLARYNATYDKDFMYLTEPYPGIVDLLKNLKESGIKTAIVSNKPHSTAVKVSDKLFGSGLIDICRGGMEGIPLKPDPTAVFEVMAELGVTAEECLYIGDTAVDMKTGKAAGIYTIGVLWGFRSREEMEGHGADEITDNARRIFEAAMER